MNKTQILPIYHPNSKNSGFACSFSQSEKDQTIFCQIIRQSGWNEEKRIGSFSESRNDPTKMVTLKLSQMEAAAILDCIDRNREYSSMHDSDKQTKSIRFCPWMNKPPEGEKAIQKGFSFSITVSSKEVAADKVPYYIGLTFAESRLIREYLIFCLQKSFSGEEKNFNQDPI